MLFDGIVYVEPFSVYPDVSKFDLVCIDVLADQFDEIFFGTYVFCPEAFVGKADAFKNQIVVIGGYIVFEVFDSGFFSFFVFLMIDQVTQVFAGIVFVIYCCHDDFFDFAVFSFCFFFCFVVKFFIIFLDEFYPFDSWYLVGIESVTDVDPGFVFNVSLHVFPFCWICDDVVCDLEIKPIVEFLIFLITSVFAYLRNVFAKLHSAMGSGLFIKSSMDSSVPHSLQI